MRTTNGYTDVEIMGIADDLSGMSGDEQRQYFARNPELMGIFPLLAAIPGLIKGAFKGIKNVVGLIKGKKKSSPPPIPTPSSLFEKFKDPKILIGVGGGALLLILLMGRKK
jgi:hypothetical protein